MAGTQHDEPEKHIAAGKAARHNNVVYELGYIHENASPSTVRESLLQPTENQTKYFAAQHRLESSKGWGHGAHVHLGTE